ncbi:MAG: hypothetical protein AD742_04835 [Methylibium sp. NZG]|nr:MAG: hypothetical protein AD742_04835 [Methylibium sp. NZG]
MFRRRLLIALSVLAAAAVLEGLAAVWAVGVAEQHVQRGRVASDIQRDFIELSATKQRLRTWVSQRLLDAGADAQTVRQLQGDLRATLDRLGQLSDTAVTLDDSAESRADHLQRREALALLARSFADLERAVNEVEPLTTGADARAAWQALSLVFDRAEDRDLRLLLAVSMQREAAAVQRERAAADATLAWTRGLWVAAAITLAAAALLAAAHFTWALRRPLDELTRGAQALQRGELQHRVPETGRNEFTAVARSMNVMAHELGEHRSREASARQQLEQRVQDRTAELQGALDTLRTLDGRRRQLFADISHELRTPTTAIRGEAEVTLRGAPKPAEEYKAALSRIVQTSKQLGSVIDDLLTMARSDIDALSLDRRVTDFGPPLASALVQASALAAERSVTVESVDLPAAPLLLLGDAQRLAQLALLLLDNAVRYCHAGGQVQAEVHVVQSTPGSPRWCELRVRDNGIGIAAPDLPSVFERHWRSDAARRHRADGTGLGLAIGQMLARAHGGLIELASEPGRGTTATLRLPLLPAEHAA